MPRATWRQNSFRVDERVIPEETAVALTYNRGTHAVMMASPTNLDDFALGFSLTERIIEKPDDLQELDLVPTELGVEARMWIADEKANALRERQRRLAGPTGCGLCGLDSLAQTMRPTAVVRAGAVTFLPEHIMTAVASLRAVQPLNAATRAVHAAGFWSRDGGLLAVREDVGRHNALDKLAGALAHDGILPATGMLVMTSRVSVELVQKAAAIGVGVLAAISAPTALAIRTAEAAGITLIGIARDDGFEVFTHPERVRGAGRLGRARDAAPSGVAQGS